MFSDVISWGFDVSLCNILFVWCILGQPFFPPNHRKYISQWEMCSWPAGRVTLFNSFIWICSAAAVANEVKCIQVLHEAPQLYFLVGCWGLFDYKIKIHQRQFERPMLREELLVARVVVSSVINYNYPVFRIMLRNKNLFCRFCQQASSAINNDIILHKCRQPCFLWRFKLIQNISTRSITTLSALFNGLRMRGLSGLVLTHFPRWARCLSLAFV